MNVHINNDGLIERLGIEIKSSQGEESLVWLSLADGFIYKEKDSKDFLTYDEVQEDTTYSLNAVKLPMIGEDLFDECPQVELSKLFELQLDYAQGQMKHVHFILNIVNGAYEHTEHYLSTVPKVCDLEIWLNNTVLNHYGKGNGTQDGDLSAEYNTGIAASIEGSIIPESHFNVLKEYL